MVRCIAATDGLVLLALAAAAAASPAPTSITLRPTAQVSGTAVLLGDVAEVAPPEAAEALAALDLGPSPGQGVARTITAGYVKVRLRHAGADLHSTVFQGERTVVTCPAQAPGTASIAAPAAPAGAAPGTFADVKPGAKVTLLVRVGGLRVATEAEAIRACSVGKEGLFRVCETRAMVKARLLNHETAEVLR